MREILFKAKRIDNGEWVEGYYQEYPEGYVHIQNSYNDWFPVLPETVCQFTGWTDSNKKKIWENDIIEVIWHSGRIERYLIWWSREMSMMTAVSLKDIEFNGHDYWGESPQVEYSAFCLMMQDPWGDIKEVKVIGNIFDDPELLEMMK